MKMFSFASLTLAFLLMGTSASTAGTICRLDAYGTSTTDMPDCTLTYYDAGHTDWGVSAAIASYEGMRANAGHDAIAPVLMHGYCRYVNNISSNDGFVPFKTATEWTNFIQKHPTDMFSVQTCAYPYSGTDTSRGLYFGPTYYNSGLGDGADSDGNTTYASVSLPYWNVTKGQWPPSGSYTHSFNNFSCYKEYSEYYCWNYVNKTCTTCDSSDIFGNCTSSHEYDCSYCADPGSVCKKQYYNWSEVFKFVGTPSNGDGLSANQSWTGSSSRVSGSRPDECNVRCTDTGHDCLNCGGVQNNVSQGCSVPDQHTFNSYAQFYCTINSGTWTTCVGWVLVVTQYETNVSNYLAAGDTCSAASERNAENSSIDAVNSWAEQFYYQYMATHG